MATITQDMRYRLSLIKYAERFGVTKAAVKYKTNRQYIYRWKRRYDGSIDSLRDHSRRPHHHPNQHTPEEIKLISDMRRRNPDAGLVVFWAKLMQRGYSRSIPGLYRFLRKQRIMAVHPPNPTYTNKWLIWDSTYSSAMFIGHLVKAFPLPIKCIQTDNGSEFTNRFTTHRDKPTLFQVHLEQHGIRHKVICPFTPRHNGKVKRSHRKDNERFYATHTFYSFEDFAKQLKVYNRRDYNTFPMRPLGWKTPNQGLKDYLASM